MISIFRSRFLSRCCSTSAASSKQVTKYVVDVQKMRSFVIECMFSVGANKTNGALVADLLLAADLRGHYSHGLNRLRIYMEDCKSGNCQANAIPLVLDQKGATAWVDGKNGLGAVVGDFCTKLAIQLAKEHGVGWVCAKGSNHFGIAGYWPLLMKEQGMIGMAMTNTSPLVFPNRSAQLALGTNPLSVVAPALKGDDFALDMATSTVALGKIELAERKGESILPQWGADSRGVPTTDPKDVTERQGGLLPLGGHEETGGYKGSGLGMMVELFSAILSGSTYGKHVRTWREVARVADLGHCFVAVDPECFAPGFPQRLQDYLDETRSLQKADPQKPVLVAGDPEREAMFKSNQAGGVIYGQAQLEHLLDIAKSHNLEPFSYQKL